MIGRAAMDFGVLGLADLDLDPATPTRKTGGGGAATVMRAMGQGGYQTVNVRGIGAANRSQMTRLIKRAQARTDGVSVRFALWTQDGSQPIKDLPLLTTLGMKFAEKFEPNPVMAASGLGVAFPFLFSGAKFKKVDFPVWDFGAQGWVLESDVLELGDLLGRYIEAGEQFGAQTCLTIDADGNGTQGNLMPRNRPLSNWTQRFSGSVTTAGDEIGDGTGNFFTRNSFAAAGTARTGASYGFVALDYRFRVPKTMISLWTVADSTGQDQKIGYDQVHVLYDVMGDADANRSFIGIAAKRLGIMQSGAERGSDGEKNLSDKANWLGRLDALVKSGATCIDLLCGLNDFNGVAPPTAWAANAALTRIGTIRANGGRAYMLVAPGTTAASGVGPSGTVLGATEADGTATWMMVGAITGTGDSAYVVLGYRYATIRVIREAFLAAGRLVPTIRISMPMLRAGTSTDGFATEVNQTPHPTFNIVRARLRQFYVDAAYRAILQCSDEVIDLTLGTETAVNSGIMRSDGGPYLDPTDLVHPLDIGHRELAALYPAPPAVTPAQLAN